MTALLEVSQLQAGYGETRVLFDVNLTINEGEVVTLMGRNGMGKTTTIKTVMGLVKPSSGHVRVEGVELASAPAYSVAQAGLGLVPEGRQIFPTLSVEENLVATAANRSAGATRWTLASVYEFFPRLRERKANLGSQLSGGEQQMLAIGRALMTNPKLLILDEATEGLAPIIRGEIWSCLKSLKETGQSILIVDKTVAALERLADRHVILEKGKTVWAGNSEELIGTPDLKSRYLGA
ncbi:ABC transporter ATP-binding protein [Roseibium sp. TrichSKD4]|uniref:ABC transporter ATP-binding protein n=1 Tax=Roseibium sp. TrichSKD4 TaxID=744980 RepID=UPI0001E567DA|nr:ABC transporter ATP-binding protein [Roseibium sp. TrichSKD4]EFO30517.1 ABC transporter ATP-binding protein [Roseibium sp. TrichSKD4]